MSNKFKVGDRVRYIGSGFRCVTGIVKTDADSPSVFVESEGCGYVFAPEDLVLLEPTESELERLVCLANEGEEARLKLQAFRDKVEVQVHFTCDTKEPPWEPLEKQWSGRLQYRVKPKPVFEPFHVGPVVYEGRVNGNKVAEQKQWKVTLEGDKVHIGCRWYNASDLKRALAQLIEYNSGTTSGVGGYASGIGLFATKSGVLENGERISWEDAEKLLAALEKAGV